MNSFKNAVYSSVKVKDKEGAYTQEEINDKLPNGYYKYYLVAQGEQAFITDKETKDSEAVIITKKPVNLSGNREDAKIVKFEDNDFSFEDFFEGYHRPIDFQIKTAEDKRNAQFQDKSRNKDINLGRDDL